MENSSTDKKVSIRDRILLVLTVYPIISPTMLQAGLGPQIRPKNWRPVLNDMIEEGVVLEEIYNTKTVHGRYHSYTRLRLLNDD